MTVAFYLNQVHLEDNVLHYKIVFTLLAILNQIQVVLWSIIILIIWLFNRTLCLSRGEDLKVWNNVSEFLALRN